MVTASGEFVNVNRNDAGTHFVLRVSCVRFSPNVMNPVIVSCGWDKVVKVSLTIAISGFLSSCDAMLHNVEDFMPENPDWDFRNCSALKMLPCT